jgi:hypothetical protein
MIGVAAYHVSVCALFSVQGVMLDFKMHGATIKTSSMMMTYMLCFFDCLKTKLKLFSVKIQSVPHSRHFSSQL